MVLFAARESLALGMGRGGMASVFHLGSCTYTDALRSSN